VTATVAPDRIRVLRIGIRVVLALLGLLLVGVVVIVFALPALTGGSARTVLTGSMSPALPVGSMVVERPVRPSELRIGDIATYVERGPGDARYVTHRVVAIDRTAAPITFVFRGDANRTPDPVPVAAADVRDRVWFDVPYLGTVRNTLLRLRLLLIGLGVLGLGGYSVSQVRAGVRETRAGR
jgi:signal peptidase